MGGNRVQRTLVPIVLLGLSVGAYFLVLLGAVPVQQEATVVLTVIAGATSVGAAVIRMEVPAMTAGIAALGFGLGAVTPIGVVSLNGRTVTIASALAIIGGLGFLISTLYRVGARVSQISPA